VGTADEDFVSRRLLVILGLLAVPVLALAACNGLLDARAESHRETRRELHEQARALVPAAARVVAEEESACVMFRPAPSCVIVVLHWTGSQEERQAAVAQRLRAAGWRPTSYNPRVFARGELEVVLSISPRGESWDELCSGREPEALDRYDRDTCLDEIQVRVT
jgi:hypothetical protein